MHTEICLAQSRSVLHGFEWRLFEPANQRIRNNKNGSYGPLETLADASRPHGSADVWALCSDIIRVQARQSG